MLYVQYHDLGRSEESGGGGRGRVKKWNGFLSSQIPD